ncbi:hypothetical protein [Marinobacter arenosus]|uniref:hypothetical protein n=1 Tax=Marinobacter arenosus TaxID=2856822 RepID=UPI001C4C6E65|nr:hypothetical protein [Marinobacter arenosus]MBW0149275.1 hypothetical protein [Marinobacter arenosus]
MAKLYSLSLDGYLTQTSTWLKSKNSAPIIKLVQAQPINVVVHWSAKQSAQLIPVRTQGNIIQLGKWFDSHRALTPAARAVL